MPDKLTAADLKAEGELIGKAIAGARRKEHNVALYMAKDGQGMVLECDIRKNATALRASAKKAGAGPKGLLGTMRVQGTKAFFTSQEEKVPSQLAKSTKKWLSERGFQMKVFITLPSGEILAGDDEDLQELQAEEASDASGDPRAALLHRFGKIKPEMQSAMDTMNGRAKPLSAGAAAFAKALKAGDFKTAEQTLTKLEQTLEQLVAIPSADTGDQALRDRLKQEFEQHRKKMKALQPKSDAGGDTLVDRLEEAFQREVRRGDTKRAIKVFDMIKEAWDRRIRRNTNQAQPAPVQQNNTAATIDDFDLDQNAVAFLRAQDNLTPGLMNKAVTTLAALNPHDLATLKTLAANRQDAFIAAVNALADFDAKGAQETTPTAFAGANRDKDTAEAAVKARIDQFETKQKAYEDAKQELQTAQQETAKTASDLATFLTRNGNVNQLPTAQQAAAIARQTELQEANQKAQQEQQAAQAKVQQTRRVRNQDRNTFRTDYTRLNQALNVASDKAYAIEDKRILLDAIAFGPCPRMPILH